MAEVGGIALVYDPVQTAMGQLTVRAFRRLRAPANKCVLVLGCMRVYAMS